MAFKLRDRKLGWSIASTLIIVLAVLVLVDSFFRTTIHTTLEENLVSGARLAGELRSSRMDGWVTDVARIALEPTLRAAVETRDPATIRELLAAALQANPQADWLAVVSPEGPVIASAGALPEAGLSVRPRLREETLYFDLGDVWEEEGALVDVGATSIFFGELRLGILLGGNTIDQERTQELATFLGQDVAFLAEGRVTAADTMLAERSAQLAAVPWRDPGEADGSELQMRAGQAAVVGPIREFQLGGETFLGTDVPVQDAGGEHRGSLLVYRSLDAALQPARQLRLALLGIGVGGLLLGLVSSLALTRSVTGPVSTLLDETVRLGSGNLEEPIHVMSRDEIGQLAQGFEQMRVSLRDARAELIRRERLSAVGRAASSLVHDFAQPVTVISAHTDLLAESWSDDREREEDLRAIRGGLDRLQRMMREVLEFARGEVRTERHAASVPILLEEVARQTQPALSRGGVAVMVEHGYRGDWVLDHQRTARALGNLVRNAANVLESRGGTIHLRSAQLDGRLCLEVADDGPGIPEDIRESLFEPFVTRGKREGTGLGLAIVKNIAESQGGIVRFDTTAEGTVFALEFPENDPRETYG